MADDGPTCGRGLAEHSAIPAKLAELIDALADNLERHMPSLPEDDAYARAERDVYGRLAVQHRDIAQRLTAVAKEMAGCKDMRMGSHDEAALGAPEVVAAFELYLAKMRQAAATLQAAITRDELLG